MSGPAWQEWTVTLPDESAVTVYIENNYEPELRFRRLIDLAEVEAYMTTRDHLPEPEEQ